MADGIGGGTGAYANAAGDFPTAHRRPDAGDPTAPSATAATSHNSPPHSPPTHLRRINMEGDAVPGSQDNDLATLARNHLHLEDEGAPIPTVATVAEITAESPASAEPRASDTATVDPAPASTPSPSGPSLPPGGNVDPNLQGLHPGSAGDSISATHDGATSGSMLGNAFARARAAARRSAVAAPTPADVPPPPTPPAVSPFRDGFYWCTKCSQRGFRSVPGLMNHFTRMHAGETVDEPTRALLTAVDRVTCTSDICGGFRRAGARSCNRCAQPTDARPPAVGDLLPVPRGSTLGAPAAQADDDGSAGQDTTAETGGQHDLPRITLPSNFVRRVRSLSPPHAAAHT